MKSSSKDHQLVVRPRQPPKLGGSATAGAASDRDSALATVERLLGYTFRNPSLLEEALTHSSSESDVSYQRLEFVGDAALNLAITNYLYLTNPSLGPGPLSALRSANISTEKLARVAVRHRLYTLLRRNSPKLDALVNQFTELVMQEPEEEQMHGGSTMKAPKVLADIVESIAAAVYEDCNFNLEIMWKIVRGMLEPIITADTLDEQPITMICELCQKSGKKADFKYWQKGGITIVNVLVEGKLIGTGSSEQKVIAKLNAARDALKKLTGEESALLDRSLERMERVEMKEAKQKLNEFCSKRHWPQPVYKVEKMEGPSHDRRFICSVQVETSDNTFITLGEYRSRVKDAEIAAASKMLSEVLINI